MELRYGRPFQGAELERLRSFLGEAGLAYDEGVRFTVNLNEGDRITATGSLDGRVLKCLAVSGEYANEGLAALIVTELIKEAARNGEYHLFIFTRPKNEELFTSMGFYAVAGTEDALLLENKKDGVAGFVAALEKPKTKKDGPQPVSAIVLNCNPLTRGHLYLIETAARASKTLHLFVVSEDKSEFPQADRYRLVKEGCAGLDTVLVHETGPYLVSQATFPDYFLKERLNGRTQVEKINTALDLAVFAERFALPLGIQKRFVGTEPLDRLTAAYNSRMKEILPGYGIDVEEIPRLKEGDTVISAGRVRELFHQGDMESIRKLVPRVSYEYLAERRARKIP
jgi:[citrate (pro-3S)-lyase] ligase